MEKLKFFTLLTLTILATTIWGCKEDSQSPRTVIIAGDPEGATYFSDLMEPDSMIFNSIHSSSRDFDLDNDGVMDITITSMRDTIYDAGIAITETRQLAIRGTDPENNVVFISTLGQETHIYGRGQVINRNNAIWTALQEDPILMAGSTQNLLNGQTEITGNWNSMTAVCLGFLLPRDEEWLAWLELTVRNVDNFYYNDHAAYILD